MMLRSSSTPILGSLLSSHGDSGGAQLHHHHHQLPESITPNQTPSSAHHKKLISVNHAHVGFQSFTKLSFNSSPNISPAVSLPFSGNGFRRAQSEGNLEGLAADALCNNADEFSLAVPLRKFARKPRASFLEAIPSFSLTGSRSHGEDEESDEYEEADEEWEVFGSANSGLSEELKSCLSKFPALEVAGVGFGSGGYPVGGSNSGRGGVDGGDSHGISTEEHYRKMVEDNPSNPLLLRNYAQFLYQTKKEAKKAEEYYSRAILADPGDGEVLSQYAKLIWEVHRDVENATSYFERAVQAAAGDSHVEAAYANFLWEVEDNEEEEDDDDGVHRPTITHQRPMASASAC